MWWILLHFTWTDAKAQSETGHTRLAQFEFSFFFSITRYLEKYWCICLDYMTRDFRDKEMKLGENRSWIWQKCTSVTPLSEGGEDEMCCSRICGSRCIYCSLTLQRHLQRVSDHQRLFCWIEDQLIVLYQWTALSKILSGVWGQVQICM